MGDPESVTFTATTALPYPHLDRATAGLRGELRRQRVAAGIQEPPRWEALTVSGPVETNDALAGRGSNTAHGSSPS